MTEDHDLLVDLQTRLAFQDKTIAELNDVIADQQKQLDQLRQQLTHVNDRLKVLEESTGSHHGDEKPPHY